MKKLLIGLLALGSISAFAGECTYKLTGDLNDKNRPFAKELLVDKGYSTAFDMNEFEYIIDVEAVQGQTGYGELVKWVTFTVKDQTGRELNLGEASSPVNSPMSFLAKGYRGLIKEAIRQLPVCK